MGGRGASISTKSTGSVSALKKELAQARTITRADIAGLQASMGQTGNEAGQVNPAGGGRAKLYVNTSKAFNINHYLNTDGKSIDSPNSNWQNLGYTQRMVQNDIARIDAGMKPLSESLKLTRWTSGNALGHLLGDTHINDKTLGGIIQQLSWDRTFQQDFTNMLKGASNNIQKGYTSASYLPTHPGFDDAQVRLNMVMRAGTPAIVTNNHSEAEILGGRGLAYNYTGNWRIEEVTPTTARSRGKKIKQLVIDVYI